MPGWYAVLNNGFSIRHLRHEDLGTVTRLWLTDTGYADVPTTQITRFEQEENVPPPANASTAPNNGPVPAAASAVSLQQLVNQAAGNHRVDADFIASVIRAESAANPRAVSPKGAQGLMQLMPQTASRLGVHNAFDPAANVEAGTRYLRSLLDLYHGDAARALAAYNAGAERVAQFHGMPPYPETQSYVRRVITDYNRRKLAADPKLAAKLKPRSVTRVHPPPSVDASSSP